MLWMWGEVRSLVRDSTYANLEGHGRDHVSGIMRVGNITVDN